MAFLHELTTFKEYEAKYSLVDSNVRIFSGNAHPDMAKAICSYLNLPLSRSTASTFTNGETRVKIEETVRGKDVYIVQPICGSVNDSLVELLLMIDAAFRASADAVTAIQPYYGYAKQEKKTSGREPISAKLFANIYTTAGADRVITVDLHAAAIQGFFDIPVDNLTFSPLLLDYLISKHYEDVVIVSPDAGGVAKASQFSDKMHASLAIIFKRRNRPDEVEVIDIVGDVAGKTAIIVDDMISTGGTLIEASRLLKSKGAKQIIAGVTHPLLAGKAIAEIENSDIEKVIVADTVPLPPQAEKSEKFVCISVAPLIGEAIRRVHYNLSVSKLFD